MAWLYRKVKTLSSWVINRNIFIDKVMTLRGHFDANRGCSNAKAIRLIRVSARVNSRGHALG